MSPVILTCSKCKAEKSEESFDVDNSRRGPIKRTSACKVCRREHDKRADKQQRAAKRAEYYQKNKEKIFAYRARRAEHFKAIREKNKEKYKINQKKWRVANKDRHSQEARTAYKRFVYSRSAGPKRGHEWHLTEEQYTALITRPCDYCGKITYGVEMGVGLDRIDCSKGYVIDNVRPCCGECNYLIGDFTKEELLVRLPVLIESLKRLGHV